MKLHNAMWPGLVGKEPGTENPPIDLDRMLELTAKAEVDGRRFDGVDLFLFHPHIDPFMSDDAVKVLADSIARYDLTVGSLVAPVWPGTVGASTIGSSEEQEKFLVAVTEACRIGRILRSLGIRKSGVIRIDSAVGTADWAKNPSENTKKIAETFRKAGKIAADFGERLAAEGEICWGGMQSWQAMIDTLEATNMPETVGFQADMAHTYLYLLGYNAPEAALLKEGYDESEFWAAYKTMTDALRPWTFDFHVAQNDGTVHGTGSHDKTGRHCLPNDPNGKLDIPKAAAYWLKDAEQRGIQHICWDGCMFANSTLEKQETWNSILASMIQVEQGVQS